ncbi:MAG TPA: AAA family ATPase [Paludibacter sp.]
MYLHTLKLWNFRKYSTKDGKMICPSNPGLVVEFQQGLNLLVGENDSGKTTIIDAIKHIFNTQSYELIRLDYTDFFTSRSGDRSKRLKIECLLKGFTNEEAGQFLEWGSFEKDKFILRVWLSGQIKDDGRIIIDIKAGSDDEGVQLDGNARNLLRTTYLKPLRDADSELSSGNRSRLAQILRSYPLLQKKKGEEHKLETYVRTANESIEGYFKDDGKEILENINSENFSKFISERKKSTDKYEAEIDISKKELNEILKSLNLRIDENKTGLGTQNLLFIATELLLLQKNKNGLQLSLIEEIEAHLHTQAQMRLIEFLNRKTNQQFILTTHSTNLTSKIDLDRLLICKNNEVYPLKKGLTDLEEDDYGFIKRFLDATKANLFFAEGVIIVEGDAENLLVPIIADIIGRPLHEWGVSIVNVGSKAFLRYLKIFKRNDGKKMNMPIACITDLDIIQKISGNTTQNTKNKVDTTESKKIKIYDSSKNRVKMFHSPLWTMEYDIATGELQTEIFQAIEISKLQQSRIKNQNLKGLTITEIEKRKELAINKIQNLTNQKFDSKRIAFEIYKTLDNNGASKAVTAQYLAEILLSNKTHYKNVILKDSQIKYIVEAIEFVTKPVER